MTIYVFTGPTLSPEAGRQELDAVYLPPVSQGDVYRVCRERPLAIGIIDGYFERVPSVWHKEILWAMSEGIHVFGSASMGALRAAELASFGMEGAGWIFEAFRDGALTDDDEVAVAHGPAESGYRTTSDAMVNIRRTLARAHASGIISADTHGALEAIAKALFYPDRSYPAILRQAADEGLEPAELEAFRAWLPGGRVDQKREDALAMLRQMRAWAATAPARKLVRYSFAHTDAWQMACQQAGTQLPTEDVDAESSERDELLDELRLDPDAFADARSRALLRLLAEGYARRQGFTVTPALRLDTTNRFRRDHGLLQPDQLDNWLAQRRLGREQFLRLMEDEARLRWVQDQLTQEIIAGIADWGRLEDDYPRLLARAEEKRRHWQAQGLQRAALSDLGLTESGLLRWYFVARLGRPLPANVARFAQAAGFTDTDAFCRAVLREYCYVTGAGAAPRQEAAP